MTRKKTSDYYSHHHQLIELVSACARITSPFNLNSEIDCKIRYQRFLFFFSGDAKLRRYLQQHPTVVGEIKGESWKLATHITHRLLEFIPVWVIFRCLNKIK